MPWNDDIAIETPEQIDVRLEIAGPGTRFVAQVIDWLIKCLVLFVAGMLGLVLLALFESTDLFESVSVLLGALIVALFYSFFLGYDIYYEAYQNGQTPGKKLTGIRVIREGGAAVDFQSVCIRNLLGMADFIPCCYLLGGLFVMFTPRGQRLGDMAAGTIVIRERAPQPPAELDHRIEHLTREETFIFTAEQLNACSSEDRHILRSYFQRSGQMDPHSRYQLARRLTQTFAQKIAFQPDYPRQGLVAVESFLAALYQGLENWAKHNR